MTRKEKVAQVEPMAIDDDFEGGVWGCPSEYPFLGLDDVGRGNCISGTSGKLKKLDCEKCWNTEWSKPACPQWQHDILDKFMRVI